MSRIPLVHAKVHWEVKRQPIASSQNVNHIVTFTVVFKVQFFTDAIKTDICIMPDSTDIKSQCTLKY